jgi:hypothetical protein
MHFHKCDRGTLTSCLATRQLNEVSIEGCICISLGIGGSESLAALVVCWV